MTYTNQTTAALITFQEPVYIKKFQIYLDCENEQKYFMNVSYINAFGVEEEERLIDLCYEEFSSGITAVGGKSIKYPDHLHRRCSGDDQEFSHVKSVSDERLPDGIFFPCLFCFWLFLRNGKKFPGKTRAIWAAAVLCMGIFIISCQGVNENGWDEQVHFKGKRTISPTRILFRNPIPICFWQTGYRENYYNTIEEKKEWWRTIWTNSTR